MIIEETPSHSPLLETREALSIHSEWGSPRPNSVLTDSPLFGLMAHPLCQGEALPGLPTELIKMTESVPVGGATNPSVEFSDPGELSPAPFSPHLIDFAKIEGRMRKG